MCLGIALPGAALAQQKPLKEQLVGAWTLVSIDSTMPDGKKMQLFGANPLGTLIFDASGNFTQMQVPSNRAKFKSANRLEATAEESKVIAHSSLAQFGTWSVSEPDKTINFRIVGALIPNGEGTEGKRINVSVTANELKFTNPGSAIGSKKRTRCIGEPQLSPADNYRDISRLASFGFGRTRLFSYAGSLLASGEETAPRIWIDARS